MRRLLRLVIIGLVLLAGLVAGSMLLSPFCAELAPPGERYDTAVVLSRGMDGAGGLDAGSLDRTDAAIGLYQRGIAAQLLMTGDVIPGEASAAALMRDRAVSLGIPPERVTIEPEAHSTLQNAQFSLALVPPEERIIVVTEGFHLWRGWASFAWAGHRPEAICQSSPVARPDFQTIRNNLPREAAAWAANLVRASIWSAAAGVGLEDRLPVDFLE